MVWNLSYWKVVKEDGSIMLRKVKVHAWYDDTKGGDLVVATIMISTKEQVFDVGHISLAKREPWDIPFVYGGMSISIQVKREWW